MTFDQALNKKRSLSSDKFIEQEMNFSVFVTPDMHDDFRRYITEIRSYFKQLTDYDAKLFSTNGQFAVYGLWFDGAIIIYKRL